jgi:DNA-binding XRE family transcriptional regulator
MSDLSKIDQVVRTRLRSLRNTLGLSLNELAARTNLSPSTISRVETGNRYAVTCHDRGSGTGTSP